MSNSVKSNVYPSANKSSYVLAYSSAFKVPVVPSGLVYLTKDLVVANVSSKSKTVIPLDSFWVDLDIWTALSNTLAFPTFLLKAGMLSACITACSV